MAGEGKGMPECIQACAIVAFMGKTSRQARLNSMQTKSVQGCLRRVEGGAVIFTLLKSSMFKDLFKYVHACGTDSWFKMTSLADLAEPSHLFLLTGSCSA